MPMSATSSGAQRDLRIDFFRGLALLFIFVDHVPDNVLAKFTLRNFGFADAAEVFVLLAGFSAVLAYGRVFEGQGFKAASPACSSASATSIFGIWRWSSSAASASRSPPPTSATSRTSRNIGVHVFSQDPARSTVLAALLVNQPNMLNILPLYIVLLMFWLPFVLWLLPRNPVAGARAVGRPLGGVELARRQPAEHAASGGWVFNPFAWQLLITIGALAAHFTRKGPIPVSRAR